MNPQAQELFDQNQRLVPFVLRSMRLRSHSRFDRDDASQVGLMALWQAARTYDPARGQFSTWACDCIRKALFEVLRNDTAAKRVAVIDPNQELIKYVPYDRPEPLDVMIERERLQQVERLHARTMRMLSPQSRRVFACRRRGMSWRQIAELFGYASEESARKAAYESVYRFRHNHKRMIKNAQACLSGGAD